MKKNLSILAVAALSFVAVACGNKDGKAADATAAEGAAVEEVVENAPADSQASAAEAVAKKIKAGESITEDDLCVMLDYSSAMIEEMMANPDKIAEVVDKYTYAGDFSEPINEWKAKAESLKPETQEKLVKFLKLNQ